MKPRLGQGGKMGSTSLTAKPCRMGRRHTMGRSLPPPLFFVLLLLSAQIAPASEPAHARGTVGPLEGKPTTLASLAGQKATVVVFLSFDCPVSNSYSETLNDLARGRAGQGVKVLGVCPGEAPARLVQ